MPRFEIRPVSVECEDGVELIDKLNEELLERYPEPGATHSRLNFDEVAPGRGVFLIAYLDDDPVGCAALGRLDGHAGEIKRMYVDGCVRGRGYARALLGALEVEARALGFDRLVLETGVRQPEAFGLYESTGFSRIDAYGEYFDSPLSICMAKVLGS